MEKIKEELNRTNIDLFSCMEKDPYNYSAIISGRAGSGVGFTAKYEIAKTYYNTQDDIIVFDDYRELSSGFRKLPDSKMITFDYPRKYSINPLDLVEDVDPHEQFERKVNLFKLFFEILSKKKCTETEEYNIKKALATVYKENESPKLIDLYNILERSEETKFLADVMLIFSTGNMDILSKNSNIDYGRITFFELNNIELDIRNLVTLSILENLNKKIAENAKKGKRTWIFISDYANFILANGDNQYIINAFKKSRLFGVKIIGITRNISDMLIDEKARPILLNTYSLELLNQSIIDSNILRNLYHFSDMDVEQFTNVDICCGLLCAGPKRIPFNVNFNSDTEVYRRFAKGEN